MRQEACAPTHAARASPLRCSRRCARTDAALRLCPWLELLGPGPEVGLEGPGRARLGVQLPEQLSDGVGGKHAIGREILYPLHHAAARAGVVDHAVDHDLRDVAVLRS